MIKVELDIFSGLPNPEWVLTDSEEKDLIDRVIADPSLSAPPETVGGLGYRGYIVSASDWARTRLMNAGLPSLFYVNAKKSGELQESLTNSVEAGKTTPDGVLQQADDSIKAAKDSIESSDRAWYQYWATHTDSQTRWAGKPPRKNPEGTDDTILTEGSTTEALANSDSSAPEACGLAVVTNDTNLSLWNNPAYISRNNCYNFAANYKNFYIPGGKAQPGWKRKVPLNYLDGCGDFPGGVRYGALLDGLRNECFTGYQYLVALAIDPDGPMKDYHWYRYCANGYWHHKPGHTSARNYDNSFSLITNPQNCNRGPYRQFCGYMYIPYGLSVASR